MVDDKKKKKNKKKNNKQATKPTESVTVDATESTSDNQNHVQEVGNDNDDQVLVVVDTTNDVIAHANADRDEHFANGNEVVSILFLVCHLCECFRLLLLMLKAPIVSHLPIAPFFRSLHHLCIQTNSAESEKQYWLDREVRTRLNYLLL